MSEPLTWVESPDGRWHLHGGVCTDLPEEDVFPMLVPLPLPDVVKFFLEEIQRRDVGLDYFLQTNFPKSRGGA